VRRLSILFVVATMAVLAGCGGRSSSISGDAATDLQHRAAAVRAAVDAHDADAATRALDALHASVDHWRATAKLTRERATQIVVAADAVRAQLPSITTTTTTTTIPASPPATNGHGKDNGNGHGNGNGGDEGGG
jgi:hypothetical protein